MKVTRLGASLINKEAADVMAGREIRLPRVEVEAMSDDEAMVEARNTQVCS